MFETMFGKRESYAYQDEIISECMAHIDSVGEKVILAAACGAGKTKMAIRIIKEILIKNPFAKILILAHGTRIIRRNFINGLQAAKASGEINFTFVQVVAGAKQLPNASVYVALPQNYNNIPKINYNFVVVDEAHQYYNAKNGMVQSILGTYARNAKQLLLTATPSIFIDQNNRHVANWPIVFLSLEELYKHGVISRFYAELIAVDLPLNHNCYSDEGYLKEGTFLPPEKIEKSVAIVMEEIMDRCVSLARNPKHYNDPNFINKCVLRIKDFIRRINGGELTLHKTIIKAANQNMARMLKRILDKWEVKNILSISDNPASGEKDFDKFKESKEDLILIVVNRGELGYDNGELYNSVDMSFALNPDENYQFMCRLTRHGKLKVEKLYLKIAPKSMIEDFDKSFNWSIALQQRGVVRVYNGRWRKIFKYMNPPPPPGLPNPRHPKEIGDDMPIIILGMIDTTIGLTDSAFDYSRAISYADSKKMIKATIEQLEKEGMKLMAWQKQEEEKKSLISKTKNYFMSAFKKAS